MKENDIISAIDNIMADVICMEVESAPFILVHVD